MIQKSAMVIFVLATLVASFHVHHAPFQEESVEQANADIEHLKSQRIQVLEERVAQIQKWVSRGRVGQSKLIRPEMDVIEAKLDYAKSIDARKELLAKLLPSYDKLIALAEFRIIEPSKNEPNNPSVLMDAESELLFLKSERIRVQILHDSIN